MPAAKCPTAQCSHRGARRSWQPPQGPRGAPGRSPRGSRGDFSRVSYLLRGPAGPCSPEALHQVHICIKSQGNEMRVHRSRMSDKRAARLGAPRARPSPCACPSGQSDGRGTGEPSGPIALRFRSAGGPRAFPAIPRTQPGECPVPRKRRCPGERCRGSPAGSSAQPVQIIVVIISEERSWRGTPLHALQVKPAGNSSAPPASQQQPHRSGSEICSSSKELRPRSLITEGLVILVVFISLGLMFTG